MRRKKKPQFDEFEDVNHLKDETPSGVITEDMYKNLVQRSNRKKMAWTALVACLVVVFLMMFVVKESRIPLLSDVMTFFFLIMGSIVGTYIGFTSIGFTGKGVFKK